MLETSERDFAVSEVEGPEIERKLRFRSCGLERKGVRSCNQASRSWISMLEIIERDSSNAADLRDPDAFWGEHLDLSRVAGSGLRVEVDMMYRVAVQ